MWNRISNGVSTTNNNKVSFYLAPGAALSGGLRSCSAPTRMDMPGDGDEVNYDQKRVDVFHVTSLSNVIIVVEFKIYSSQRWSRTSHSDKY